ncbi:MAG: twin-arginine translocase TatA/TatE family subunit [Candidatus Scalinduaceae bacterium]
MKSLGKGIVEFKKGIKGVEDEIEDDVNEKHDKIETENKNHTTEMKG